MNVSISFRLFCETAAFAYVFLEILRGKLARGRPKIDPLAHALQGVCVLQILGEKGINISFAFNWYWSLLSEGALQ